MDDVREERRAIPRPSTNDAETRLHSDVARKVDLDRLEVGVMSALRSQATRIDGVRDELSAFVVDHAQAHFAQTADWEKRWSGIAVDLAYKRGLISLPRAALEWLRQYLPTLATLGAILATALGFATGAIDVRIGA